MAGCSRELFFEQFDELSEGAPSMAARVLVVCAEFGRTTTAVWYKKQRVIPEATFALARMQNGATPFTVRYQRLAVTRFDECRNTVKSGTTILDALQFGKQFVVVGFVIAIRARVACRVDARRAIERVNR